MSDTQQKDSAPQGSVLETRNISGYQNSFIFKGKDNFLFAFKKSQKLSAAIYLITESVPEDERLRQDLRQLSVSLVKDILSSASSGHTSLSPLRIIEIISLLEIASSARLISPMNGSVLKSEYEQVLSLVSQDQSQSVDSGVVLSEELLKADVPMPDKRSSVAPVFSGGGYHVSPVSSFVPAPRVSGEVLSKGSFKGQDKGQEAVVTKERSLSILGLIKNSQNPLSIKDITTHISGVGEKTIQRELGALVAQGVLKRQGERRWSRYSLR